MFQQKEIVKIDIVTKDIDSYRVKEWDWEIKSVFEQEEKSFYDETWGIKFALNKAEISLNKETWEYHMSVELSDFSWDLFSWFSALGNPWDKISLYFANFSDTNWNQTIGKCSNKDGPLPEKCFYYFADYEFETFYEKNIVLLNPEIYENEELFSEFKEVFEELYWEGDYYADEAEYSKACQTTVAEL